MRQLRTTFFAGIGALLWLGGCAHTPKQETTFTPVTNRDVTGDPDSPGPKVMTYTEVSDATALGRNHPDEGSSQARTEPAPAKPGAEAKPSADAAQDVAMTPEEAMHDQAPALAPQPALAGLQADCEEPVYFDTASAQLDARAKRRLNNIAACLKQHQIEHLTVVGRTDPRGPKTYNHELAAERAEHVAKYLQELGVPRKDIRVLAKGEQGAQEAELMWPTERRTDVDTNRPAHLAR